MELQLIKVSRTYPSFFDMINNSILTAYATTKQQMPADMLSDELCQQRVGYYNITNVDHELRKSVENAALKDVLIVPTPNANRSNLHVEIRTPYAIFMVAKINSSRSVPRKTNYRQVYLNQVFMPEVFPEYKLLASNSVPLYVITHLPNRINNTVKEVRLGRLAANQKGWECNYSIADLLKHSNNEEKIQKQNIPQVHEEIVVAKNRVKVKVAE